METFPLNNLAEKFEVDRSVMVKAMRNVPPDLVRKGNIATSGMGQKQTSASAFTTSALPRKRTSGSTVGMSAKCRYPT
jgi:hypothetical protein